MALGLKFEIFYISGCLWPNDSKFTRLKLQIRAETKFSCTLFPRKIFVRMDALIQSSILPFLPIEANEACKWVEVHVRSWFMGCL